MGRIVGNKWQEYYKDILYDGKMPRTKQGKAEYAFLGKVKDSVTVHFPEFHSPIVSQCHPAETKTFKVSFDECNIPDGIISVLVLASNLILWTERKYQIDY